MKKIIVLFSFLLISLLSQAQISFKAKLSTDKIEVGETFQITYLISSNGGLNYFSENKEPVFPIFNDFIEMGSYQSSSVNIVNGNSSSEISYIKTFKAKKVGVFIIPKAKLINEKNISSNSLKIVVVASSKNNSNATIQSPLTQNSSSNNSTDLPKTFLKWVVNKNNPYVSEGIKLSLKVYSKEVEAINNIQAINFPKFQGLTTHLIKNEQKQFQLELEQINGEEFGSVTLQEWIVFPQAAEKITIAPASIEIIAYSSFFNDDVITVSSDLVELNPKNLPLNAPLNFSGAVGQFKIISFLEKNEVKKGDSTSYEIEIIGNGNLDFIKPPEIEVNDSLEVFSPKERQNYSATSSGLKGKIATTYLLVPQLQGEVTIPAISFSFFDPIDGVYKTINSNKHILEINGEKKIEQFKSPYAANKNDFLNKINGNLVLAILFILLLIYAIYKFYFFRKSNKPSIELTNSNTIEEKNSHKKLTIKERTDELFILARDNKKEEFFTKQETFLNEWIEFKTNIPRYKISDKLVEDYFINAGYNKLQVEELDNIIHTAKQAKYASKLQEIDVNLIESFNKMISIIEKF